MQQLPKNTLLQGGKYKIEKVLGQGGFGITYLATQELLDRKVCIKEFFFKEYCERNEATSHVSLGTQSNHEIVERFMNKFLKEARTISQLDHRNIIKIHDIFKENNTAYYVMDYVEGESLNDMVNRRGALPEKEAVAYIERVADALKYIHQHNINHLDIKPSNIMIRQGDYRVILIDFGLSKQYDEQGSQTSTTPVGISHGYAPMEQYKQGGVSIFSPQTDIYALGATLYKLVTGNIPPQAMDILDEGLPSLPSSISPSVADAIKKAMQPRKVDRPKSVDEFLSGLNVSTQNADFVYQDSKIQSKQVEDEVTMILNQPENKEKKQSQYVDDRSNQTISFESVEKEEKKKSKKVGCSLALILGCFILFFMLKNCDGSNYTNTPIVSQSLTPEIIYNEALTYYEKKDYSNAIPLIEKVANMGYTPAQALLGYCYSNGEGVSKNDVLAFEWTKKAADKNDLMAFYNLGVFYFNGLGINKNEETAVYWWSRAAHEGYVSAQYNLALCYFYGNGIKKDVVKAKEWLEKAASQDFEDAKKFLKENNFKERKDRTVLKIEDNQPKETSYPSSGILNGHEWVDLGLSVKWATMNVGASNIGDYGDYFAWGEKQTKSEYNEENCITYNKIVNDFTGNSYYDAACSNWGNRWRLPTKNEFEELRKKCTWSWTIQNGSCGYKVTGSNGNSIFLPAEGCRFGTSSNFVGINGYYWTSSPSENLTSSAWILIFSESSCGLTLNSRVYGHNIRAVTDK